MLLPSRSIVSRSVTSKTGSKEHCILIFCRDSWGSPYKEKQTALSVVLIISFSVECDSNQWLNHADCYIANHYNKLGIFFFIFVNWNIYLLIICKKRGDYHQSRLFNMLTARVTDKNFHGK